MTHLGNFTRLFEQYAGAGGDMGEEEKATTLLGSLPASYSPLCMMLSHSEGLNLDKTKAALLAEAERREGNEVSTQGTTEGAFAAETNNNSMPAERARELRTCFYCKKKGHLIADCQARKRKESRVEDASVAFNTPVSQPSEDETLLPLH